jgi:hypothetical protein
VLCSWLKPKKMRLKFHWILFLSLAVLSAGAYDKETANDLANETPSGNNINFLNVSKMVHWQFQVQAYRLNK